MDFSKTILGIELGSTRIKGVLIDENHQGIASGSYGWENKRGNDHRGCHRYFRHDARLPGV